MGGQGKGANRNLSWPSLCYIDADCLTTDTVEYGYSLWQKNFKFLPRTLNRKLLHRYQKTLKKSQQQTVFLGMC